jgi:GNAT superfamily N-acetyltransferase
MHTVSLSDITIRTSWQSGDIGMVTYLHGILYKQEFDYGLALEAYVAEGLYEFYTHYDPANNRIWACEHNGKMIGFLALMNRGTSAQLRYFFILKEYRGIGLGKKLMKLYMEFLHTCGYASSYLWTTDDCTEAIALYTRFGFRLVEEKPTDAFDRPVLEQRYEWSAIS